MIHITKSIHYIISFKQQIPLGLFKYQSADKLSVHILLFRTCVLKESGLQFVGCDWSVGSVAQVFLLQCPRCQSPTGVLCRPVSIVRLTWLHL